METKNYIQLRTILISAINDDLITNDYSDFISREYADNLFHTNPNHWSEKDKLAFAYRRYQREIGDHREKQDSVVDSVVYWLQGLALPITHWNDDIEELGLNSETYWHDLARVFIQEMQIRMGFKDLQELYNGELIT